MVANTEKSIYDRGRRLFLLVNFEICHMTSVIAIFTFALLSIDNLRDLIYFIRCLLGLMHILKIASVSGIFFKGFVFWTFLGDIKPIHFTCSLLSVSVTNCSSSYPFLLSMLHVLLWLICVYA
jgi:hypothetical protein